MQRASDEQIEALKQFDTATLFNAVVEDMGGSQGGSELEGRGGVPENYTGPEIRCLTPELSPAVGYAVTCEATPLDPDSPAIDWDEYYEVLERTQGPLVAVFKDVDMRPGRGAIFGDGMASVHKALGVTGVVVEGSVRDVAGIREVGIPVWGTGVVLGHGVFSMVRYNASVTVGQLRVAPSELLVADAEGCLKMPPDQDLDSLMAQARRIQDRESRLHELARSPDFTLAKRSELRNELR